MHCEIWDIMNGSKEPTAREVMWLIFLWWERAWAASKVVEGDGEREEAQEAEEPGF